MRADVLTPSDMHSVCPWKGTASYYSLEVDGAVNNRRRVVLPRAQDAAKQITDDLAFWKGVEVSA